MTPLVSIIIPVFNGENYLREAIDSALSQTHEQVEILVVNDGSTDGTEEIALSYGNKIRYFAKENGGVSTALNMGIKNMNGEYFSWLSHDDLYRNDKVEIQIRSLQDSPKRIAYSDYAVIDKNGKTLAVLDIMKKYPDADHNVGLFPVMHHVLNGNSLLIHRSHFDRAGMFDEKLVATQDYDLWFRMLRNAELVYTNQPLVLHREHEMQVTHKYRNNLVEVDNLWYNILNQLTTDEMRLLNGSERLFWIRQLEVLRLTRYKKAKQLARLRAKEQGIKMLPARTFAKWATYSLISFMSRLAQKIGIKNSVINSKAFGFLYKTWFEVRYK